MSEEVRLLLVNNLSAEDYLIVSNSFYKLENELETLRKLNDANYKSFIDTNKQLQQKENIIKEVREYCKNDDNFHILDLYSQDIVDGIHQELLEILDKVDTEDD